MKHRITSRIAALAVMSAGSLLAIQSAVTAPLDTVGLVFLPAFQVACA